MEEIIPDDAPEEEPAVPEDAPQEEPVVPDEDAPEMPSVCLEPPMKKRKLSHRLIFVGSSGICSVNPAKVWNVSVDGGQATQKIKVRVKGAFSYEIAKFDTPSKLFPTLTMNLLLNDENMAAMECMEGVVDLRQGCAKILAAIVEASGN